jgi:cytochrome c
MKNAFFLLLLGFFALPFAAQASNTKPEKMPSVAIDSTNLNDFVGRFKLSGAPIEALEFSIANGQLYLQAGPQGTGLDPQADKTDTFQAGGGMLVITFVRNEENKVIKANVNYQGMMMEAVKE